MPAPRVTISHRNANGFSGQNQSSQQKVHAPCSNSKKDSTQHLTIGQLMVFAGYNWKILDIQNNRILLLSDTIMTKGNYHDYKEEVTWDNCTIREYLNGVFYDTLFNPQEKAFIQETLIINSHQRRRVNIGQNTMDKLFLLSVDEVVRYLGDSGQLSLYDNMTKMNIFPDYESKIDDCYNQARIALDEDGIAYPWYLRTPSYHRKSSCVRTGVTTVCNNGIITNVTHVSHNYFEELRFPAFVVGNDKYQEKCRKGKVLYPDPWRGEGYGIRPALWLEL